MKTYIRRLLSAYGWLPAPRKPNLRQYRTTPCTQSVTGVSIQHRACGTVFMNLRRYDEMDDVMHLINQHDKACWAV